VNIEAKFRNSGMKLKSLLLKIKKLTLRGVSVVFLLLPLRFLKWKIS